MFYTLLLVLTGVSLLSYNYYILRREKSQLNEKLNELKSKYNTLKEDTIAEYEAFFKAWCISKEKEIRKDALDRSRRVIRGQATEHLAPHLIGELNPKDYRFMGNPIDYMVFNGASDIADGEADELKEIIFLEIKTGNSKLSKIERRIKKCIEEKKVSFRLVYPDKEPEDES
ncbi:MAG: Holliday junction resolvase [Magnetovibrio sp.]|nr:Holliday junction resolvase [Magnetovibrio sp.]|tara:strand:- start:892 stop:1407 length:516 start_codon:yes stop_codon:yes gene_type:complete